MISDNEDLKKGLEYLYNLLQKQHTELKFVKYEVDQDSIPRIYYKKNEKIKKISFSGEFHDSIVHMPIPIDGNNADEKRIKNKREELMAEVNRQLTITF